MTLDTNLFEEEVLDSFGLPLPSGSVDHLYSIFAFHWTTDPARGAREIRRARSDKGEMDLIFVGASNGAVSALVPARPAGGRGVVRNLLRHPRRALGVARADRRSLQRDSRRQSAGVRRGSEGCAGDARDGSRHPVHDPPSCT
ncbi:MAG: methyltransferase domain-containing protein [Vicinamibacterales bacterium]